MWNGKPGEWSELWGGGIGEKKPCEMVWTIERMGSEEFVKKVYMSESVGPSSRGRPPVRCRDRVKEYMCERGATRGRGLDQGRRECLDRERWRLFCHDHRAIDR